MQLDKVVCPPGVFAPARTFSLVRDGGGIYLIYTGPAMGAASGGGVAGVAAGAILDKVAQKRAAAIEETETRLRQSGPGAMARTKHSRFLPNGTIRSVTLKGGAQPNGWPVAVVQADKRITLHFHTHDPASVRAFFEPFLSVG
ncbi:MAG: hypothetical protein ACOY3Y_12335 [Acidobacteriota bacterium]